jgi:glycosyltransferase involved in cell wall biosynthesis/SAM-dependent methyltransferase
MRLAYFSPLPPSKSGIADYSAELLTQLARGADISAFVEQTAELRVNRKRQDYAVHEVTEFSALHAAQPFDLCLYHQGNNPHHEYIYERALAVPGLLVLHEHCLHHLIAWKTLGREDEEGYWDEMFYAYGSRGARLAELRTTSVSSEYQQFLLPLNRRLVKRSRGVIVHNQYAASQLEDVRVPVEIIPHHLAPQAYELDKLDKLECRRALGLPEEAWIVASFGYVTQAKRLPTLLKAFQRLLPLVPNALCLIVGEDHWRWSIAPLIKELGLQHHVRITGYNTERDFFRYLKAIDVVVNLRYPTAGETSGTLIRALGAGKPVVVSDFGQFGEFPEDICLKVAPGENEEKELYARLRALAYRQPLRECLGARAAEWVRTRHDIGLCAARYLSFAERLIREQRSKAARRPANKQQHDDADVRLNFPAPQTIKFAEAEALHYVSQFFTNDPQATSYLHKHGRRIIETVQLAPVGAPEQRLLELSSYLQMTPLIKRYGHYGEIVLTNWWQGPEREITRTIRHSETNEELSFKMQNVDVERDRFPFPDAHFDVALCCELIEHLTEDPMHMLIELNRVLKWGGLLILTTPNITSAFSLGKALAGNSPYVYGEYNPQSRGDRHSREYAPSEIRVALNAAGFKVVKLFTKDLWCQTDDAFLRGLDHTGVPRELRGDNIFAVGRKLSTQFDRYPDGLYD